MRVVGVIALLFCSPLVAQSIDIDGYSTVVVAAASSGIDDMLGRAAADAGFDVHGTIEDVPEANRAKTLYMSIVASSMRGSGNGVNFFVIVQDVATSARIAVCEASVPSLMGKKSFVERAAMQSTRLIIERLGYGGFNQNAHERNLRALGLVVEAGGNQLPTEVAPQAPQTAAGEPRMKCDAGISQDDAYQPDE
jgi:hypothetical protein